MPIITASGHAFLAQVAASHPLASQMTPCMPCRTPGLLKPAKKCNGCKIVQYCSKTCQRTAWPEHKAFCQLVSGAEKVADAFLKSMEPVDVLNFVLDCYRWKVLWNENHLGKLADLLGPKVSPVFHVPDRSILGDSSEADFETFVRGAVESRILPKYLCSEVGIKGCLASAVHLGNTENLFTPANIESLASKYKNVNIDVTLLILAERVVGFDAGGPPRGLTIWMEGFVETVQAHPEAAEYVQKIETDRIAARLQEFKAEHPDAPRPSDRFRGLEDNPKPEMISLMDKFIDNFRPDKGRGAFEQLVALQKQTDPDNAELHESTQKIRELYDSNAGTSR